MTFNTKVEELGPWNKSLQELALQFQTSLEKGLTSADADSRSLKYGKNILIHKKKQDSFSLLISQFKSPIILIFIFTSFLSIFLGQIEDALIIIIIVIISGILGFWQEKRL